MNAIIMGARAFRRAALCGILFFSFFLVSWSVQGQSKRHTTVDFEDELIQGEFRKMDLFYFQQNKPVEMEGLLRLRENFLPEMRQTADRLRRKSTTE